MRAKFEENSTIPTRAAFIGEHFPERRAPALGRAERLSGREESLAHSARAPEAATTEELRRPRQSAQEPQEPTIFPYIPRKRQERNGLLIDYLYLPAGQEAGDQVDFLILGENRMGVLLADVSGKMPEDSAPVLKTVLRSNSTGLSAAATLRYLEQALEDSCTQEFALTAFYAIFDQNKRLLNFASAGHLPMMLYRPSLGKIFLLNTSGAPFGENREARAERNGNGFDGASKIESAKVALKQNDLLVLYSDGVLAARNKNKEVFGRQRLVEFLAEHGDLEPTKFLVELRRYVEKFSAGRPLQDDLTVIVLKNILRNLETPPAEAEGADLATHFMSTEQEQAILAILRKNQGAGVEEILAHLREGDHAYLTRAQVEAYLEQNGRWLRPWPAREEKFAEENAARTHNNGAETQMLAAAQRLQNELIAAFPIQHLLAKQYQFNSKNPALAQALREFHNGDYARALENFSRLRPKIKNSAAVHCFFGNLYLLLHEPGRAQQEFFEALNFDPRSSHALVALSYVALLKGELNSATESLATALRVNAELEEYQAFFKQLIAVTNGHDEHGDWLL